MGDQASEAVRTQKCEASVAGFLEGQWWWRCRVVNGAQQTRSILKSCHQSSSYRYKLNLKSTDTSCLSVADRHPWHECRGATTVALITIASDCYPDLQGVRVAGIPAYLKLSNFRSRIAHRFHATQAKSVAFGQGGPRLGKGRPGRKTKGGPRDLQTVPLIPVQLIVRRGPDHHSDWLTLLATMP